MKRPDFSLGADRKRILLCIASVLLMLVFVYAFRYAIEQSDPFVPDDTVSSMDNKRSQVYVSGDEYKLDAETAKEHKQNERKRSDILSQSRSSDNNNRDRSGGLGDDGDNNPGRVKPEDQRKPDDREREPGDPDKPRDDDDDPYDDSTGKDDDERSKVPTIKFSFRDGETMTGSPVKFWILAKDYHGTVIPAFSNGDGKVEVWLNGAKIVSTGSDGGKIYYNPAVKSGKNTVKVTAYDSTTVKGKWTPHKRTITRKFTANIDTGPKIVGSVTVSISAPSLGIGTISSGIKVDITKDESVHDVLKEAFKKAGISSTMSASYLSGISKKGIAKKARITDELREKAREKRVTIKESDDWPKNWEDRLFEKDFCDASGWHYEVNGSEPNVGIGSKSVDDGDTVDLVFHLFDGDTN